MARPAVYDGRGALPKNGRSRLLVLEGLLPVPIRFGRRGVGGLVCEFVAIIGRRETDPKRTKTSLTSVVEYLIPLHPKQENQLTRGWQRR